MWKLTGELGYRVDLRDAIEPTRRLKFDFHTVFDFFEAGAATRPVPRGAGMRRTETEPQVPESFMGIV